MHIQLNISRNIRWNTINWRKTQKKVFKWQQEIYSASKAKEIRKVRKLQKILIRSLDARLLATRKVTQDNTGKKTAGVDKVKSLTPKTSNRFFSRYTYKGIPSP